MDDEQYTHIFDILTAATDAIAATARPGSFSAERG